MRNIQAKSIQRKYNPNTKEKEQDITLIIQSKTFYEFRFFRLSMTMYLYLIIWVYEYIEYDTFYVILWMLMNKVLIETNFPCLFHNHKTIVLKLILDELNFGFFNCLPLVSVKKGVLNLIKLYKYCIKWNELTEWLIIMEYFFIIK